MIRHNNKSPVKAWKNKSRGSKKNNDSFYTIKNMASKSKIVFIIPQTDNYGNAFSKEIFDWVDRSLYSTGGGFHYHPVLGGWVTENGGVQFEDCRKYQIGIDKKEIPNFFQFLVYAKQVFQQKSLYVELEGKIIIL